MMSPYLSTLYSHPKDNSTCWYNFPILFTIIIFTFGLKCNNKNYIVTHMQKYI